MLASSEPVREGRYPYMTSPTSGLNLSDSVYERLLRERIIFLGTDVNDDIANKLCAQMLLLSAEDPRGDISLYIKKGLGTARMQTKACNHFIKDKCCFRLGCQLP